jgi:hypothetical protein
MYSFEKLRIWKNANFFLSTCIKLHLDVISEEYYDKLKMNKTTSLLNVTNCINNNQILSVELKNILTNKLINTSTIV